MTSERQKALKETLKRLGISGAATVPLGPGPRRPKGGAQYGGIPNPPEPDEGRGAEPEPKTKTSKLAADLKAEQEPEVATVATEPESNGAAETTPVGSNTAACLMRAAEPSYFIEPPWGKFILDLWPKLPECPAVLMEGARGTGKTLIALVIAARLGRPCLLVNCQPDMTAEMLLGTPRIKAGSDYWSPGPIMLAAQHNAILVLDEFNVLSPAAQLGIKPICDGVIKGLYIPYTGERIEWPDPRVICCVNPDYQGTRMLQEACRDTMETVCCDYLPQADEIRMICARTGADKDVVSNAVNCANAIRAAARGENSADGMPLAFDLSPRALLSFGRRVVARQSADVAWKEAVIDRCGTSFQGAATREAVRQISMSIGGYNALPF